METQPGPPLRSSVSARARNEHATATSAALKSSAASTAQAIRRRPEDIAGIIENNWEKLGYAEGEFDEDILGIHASELWGYGDDGYERQKD